MISNSESNALAKQLPIGYKIQNYTVKAYLNQSYFANCYLVEAPSIGETRATGETQNNNGQVRQLVLKEYFPYFVTRQSNFSLDAGDFQEHLNWGKAHALKKAQFLSKLQIPNIANIRSYFEANNTVYLVRDYYEGMTLAEWLRHKRLEHLGQKLDLSPDAISEAMLSEVKLSLEDSKKLIYPIIDALGFMHSYRATEFAYAHENISPENIFLENIGSNGTASHKAVLLDGIGAGAKINPDLLAAGYTPPESYGQYEAYQPSGDVYSLAAILYSLLTGDVPAHAQERLDSEDNLDLDFTQVPAEVDLKLSKALNTDPNQRYGSALSFIQALKSPLANPNDVSTIQADSQNNSQDTNALENIAENHQNPTAFIELKDTMVDELDPALKATEIGSILWTDPNEELLPLTFGDHAGGPNHNGNSEETLVDGEVVLNHPDFRQIDASKLNGSTHNGAAHNSSNNNPVNGNSAQAGTLNSDMASIVFEESVNPGVYNSGAYDYSESVQLTAPESFLTQEREISAEEAKTTLFSVHPIHPMETHYQTGVNARLFDTALSPERKEQAVLHHAELLKGSTAFQYIDGKLTDNSTDAELYPPQVDNVLEDTNLENASELKKTGIKGLTQWPITTLDDNHKTRERKPVQKRLQNAVDILNPIPEAPSGHVETGYQANYTTSASTVQSRPQILRLIMLTLLLCSLAVLLFSLRVDNPRIPTPFQNGTARASAPVTPVIPTQTPNLAAQNLEYASNTQPTLAEGERLNVIPEFVLSHHKQAVRAVAFSPQGNLIASAGDDKQIILWDSFDQSIVKTLKSSSDSAFIKDIAFNNEYLASVDTDGMVAMWNVSTGAKTRMDLYKHGAALNTLSFSTVSDGETSYLAAGSEDGKVLLWEYYDNRFGKLQLLDVSEKAISNIAFNPKNSEQLVAADSSLRIHLWDTNRSRKQTITAWNSMSRLHDLQFSSNGEKLALGGLDKDSVGIVSVWDVTTRKLELNLYHPKFRSEGFSIRPESANSVRAITTDPNGQWWATAGIDGIIHLWSSESGALIQSMPTGQKGIYALDANPNYAGLVTASADGSVQTWLLE